jgi:hypothetical protein
MDLACKGESSGEDNGPVHRTGHGVSWVRAAQMFEEDASSGNDLVLWALHRVGVVICGTVTRPSDPLIIFEEDAGIDRVGCSITVEEDARAEVGGSTYALEFPGT